MNKKNEFNNIKPLQLELPYTEFSNIANNAFYENSYPVLSDDMEFLQYFDPIITSTNWDKRSLKKFIAEIYITDNEYQIVECYAASKMIAKKFLQDSFVLNELHSLPDFPSNFLNKKIKESRELYKSFEEQMNAQ